MYPCIAVGDSLAVGVGLEIPDCEIRAKVGITSSAYIYTLNRSVSTDLAVISLGVNDGVTTIKTEQNLRKVRLSIRSSNVYWLLPGINPELRELIIKIAKDNGDRWIDTKPYVGADGLHPPDAKTYHKIADQVK